MRDFLTEYNAVFSVENGNVGVGDSLKSSLPGQEAEEVTGEQTREDSEPKGTDTRPEDQNTEEIGCGVPDEQIESARRTLNSAVMRQMNNYSNR